MIGSTSTVSLIFEVNLGEKALISKIEFLGDKKTSYSERKKLSIIKTKEILEDSFENKNWMQHFVKHGKKDDLADSFLQALWYINNN